MGDMNIFSERENFAEGNLIPFNFIFILTYIYIYIYIYIYGFLSQMMSHIFTATYKVSLHETKYEQANKIMDTRGKIFTPFVRSKFE